MTHPTYNFKKLILAGGTMFSMLAVPFAVNTVTGLDLSIISAAQAAEDGGSANKGKGSASKGGGQKGSANKGGQGKGGSTNKVFRMPADAAADSDRPVWAGVKGGKAGAGTKPGSAGTKKGDLFGDMVVVYRDVNGVPILNAAGLVQVIAYVYDASGKLVPLGVDANGVPLTIPYDAEGNLLPDRDGVAVYSAEVDLGRLSVGRSPTKVLDKSLTDALTSLASGIVKIDPATGRLTVTAADGTVSTIDSPLANLALYDAVMTGTIVPGTAYTIPGTTTTITLPANLQAAALFAAAADKTGSINVDTIVYMDSILGINTSSSYYSFTTKTSNYDRATTWSGVTATVLVLQPDGVSYKAEPVDLYQAVFNSTNWTDPTPSAPSAADFAAEANDYLQVLEFVHDNAVR